MFGIGRSALFLESENVHYVIDRTRSVHTRVYVFTQNVHGSVNASGMIALLTERD